MDFETSPFHLDRINDMSTGDDGRKEPILGGRALFPQCLSEQRKHFSADLWRNRCNQNPTYASYWKRVY